LLAYQSDPVRESVKRLGSKWTLLLLRDMSFLGLSRFGQLLRNNPGLSPRVLSRRLREMQQEGLVERVEVGENVSYRLTPRGEDAVFILLAFLRYGMKHHMSKPPKATPRSLQPGRPFRRAPSGARPTASSTSRPSAK
jgi:DNA-binding HxlR family transcriptional regulator